MRSRRQIQRPIASGDELACDAIGYFIGPELFDLAEADDGRTVMWMREEASRRGMLVAGSIAEQRGDRLLNTLFIAEPDHRLHRS